MVSKNQRNMKKQQHGPSRTVSSPHSIRISGVPWLFDAHGAFTTEGAFLLIIGLARKLEESGMLFPDRVVQVTKLRALVTLEDKLRFVTSSPGCTQYLSELSRMTMSEFWVEFQLASDDYNNRDERERG
jgi:hypothetical protein